MRNKSLFWGTCIFIFGVLLLLNNLNIISVNVWGIFVALFLIFMGVWMLFGRYFIRGYQKEEPINIPIESAIESKITFAHGAGRIYIDPNPGSPDLITGVVTGGVEVDVDREDSTLEVHLESSRDWFLGIPPAGPEYSRDWKLKLSDQIPLRLIVKTGASQSEINLESLQVKEFNLYTGASQASVILPAHAGYTDVKVESGAANTDLKIPVGVAARIRFSGGLAKIDVDPARFPGSGNLYQSSDYDTAANRINIQVQTGVGNVTIS